MSSHATDLVYAKSSSYGGGGIITNEQVDFDKSRSTVLVGRTKGKGAYT